MTRALLEQALEVLEKVAGAMPFPVAVSTIKALKVELAKQEQPAPAWHDKPTEPGLWVQWLPGIGNTFEYVGDYTYSGEWGGRWYGPIPKDTK